MNIVLHIERLVLDGVPLATADHEALKASLTGELSRLLADGLHPDLQSGGARAWIVGGSIELSPGAGGAQLGPQLARAVHAAIGTTTGSGGGNSAGQ